MRIMKHKPDYDHIKCACGGIIAIYNREDFTCNKCGRLFDLSQVHYDRWIINNKTGWIFPVVNRKEEN